jgi:hypothetical protein
MKNLTIFQTIKLGFWLGVGFMIPSLLGSAFTALGGFYFAGFMVGESMRGEFEMHELPAELSDITGEGLIKGISIESYEDKSTEKRLIILGSLKNNNDKTVNSINLEAEFFDKNGKFVYECGEYINGPLVSGVSENYKISCGCNKGLMPKYDNFTVRVIDAQSYSF